MYEYRRKVESANAGKPNRLRGWFGHLVPSSFLAKRSGERKRGLDRECLFWGFLGQVMRGGSCRDALQEIQAARAADGLPALSPSTSSYCAARGKKFSSEELKQIHREVSASVAGEAEPVWEGRRVLSVDGTGVSMDDTPANQEEFPQPTEQKKGCGFPVMQVVGLHDLSSGALLDYEESPLNVGESALFHGLDLIERVGAGDILLFDRAYCSYLNTATLLGQGAHALGRLHASRKISFPKGCDDMIATWDRPTSSRRPHYMELDQWKALPKSIRVRYIRQKIETPGHRPEEILVVTTMLDVPAERLLELFLRRWNMEVSLRDLKTTLGADHLRAKTPEMARKIFAMHMIAHNLIRWTLLQASIDHLAPLDRLSFKGTVDLLENWRDLHSAPRRENWERLLELIAKDKIPKRPNRIEPRVLKRRPKTFPKMMRPRKDLRNRIFASKSTT
ncbi:MAG: IS4 family transposase, partial [Puniceicoccales bacterium]